VFGENLNAYNERPRVVFDRMRKYNLKLQSDKYEFLRKEVSYLGHVIGETGIKPEERRIEAVKITPDQKLPENSEVW
jgi:hypothetical protein